MSSRDVHIVGWASVLIAIAVGTLLTRATIEFGFSRLEAAANDLPAALKRELWLN